MPTVIPFATSGGSSIKNGRSSESRAKLGWPSRDGRRRSQEVLRDEEGLQVMRVLGRNMAFLIRAIAREREAAGLPETEPQRIATNFIR